MMCMLSNKMGVYLLKKIRIKGQANVTFRYNRQNNKSFL